MSELRDAIAFDALDDVRVNCMAYCYGGTYDKREAADAVLAMPEMQAIRKALHWLAEIVACEWGINPHDVLEGRHDDDINIGAAGVAWVLEGKQP